MTHPRDPENRGFPVYIDQDQIARATFLMIEILAPVAQVLDEFPVAVDVGVQVPKKNPGGVSRY
jgi:hypothetical protein